ncbi:MAG: hypothetical protein NEA02_03065, partial [Thermoanaerobaculia bacterium]|nr:hypothetical protein [Thermoanaerobaculia bacterium]
MRPRGFSLRELGLTLLLLAVVIVAAVRLIDLRTKLLVVEKDDPGLGSVLEAAARALSRDVKEAGRGGIPPGEAVRPVADNTKAEGGARYEDVSGPPVVVRAGTAQLGLRGVMRTPLLAVRLSREAKGGGAEAVDRIPADTSSVWIRAVPLSGIEDPGPVDKLRAVAERLGAATRRAKRFFLVTDRDGRSAVALVREWNRSQETGAALEIRLDFTDREAARLNPRGETDAARALGEPVTGGLLDDVVWFVAQGPAGRLPDYDAAHDPPSMKFPHPFLAVAEFAGDGRWEIARVGEEVEDFQVATEPGQARTLKLAWTAKAERRYARGDGPRPSLEFPPLLNAPA